MTTPMFTKIAALAVAGLINAVLLTGVGYLFSGQVYDRASLMVMHRASAAREVRFDSKP